MCNVFVHVPAKFAFLVGGISGSFAYLFYQIGVRFREGAECIRLHDDIVNDWHFIFKHKSKFGLPKRELFISSLGSAVLLLSFSFLGVGSLGYPHPPFLFGYRHLSG
nr:MAG TPA: hypothetical protein [Caudoviricetes sp.]